MIVVALTLLCFQDLSEYLSVCQSFSYMNDLIQKDLKKELRKYKVNSWNNNKKAITGEEESGRMRKSKKYKISFSFGV